MPRLPDPKVIAKGPQEGMEEIRSSFQDTLKGLGLSIDLPRLPGTKSNGNGKGGLHLPQFIKPFVDNTPAPAAAKTVKTEAAIVTEPEPRKEYSPEQVIPFVFE